MDQRIIYLLIGCLVGFVVGYIVRSLTEIKEKVDHVDQHLCDLEHQHEEGPPPPSDRGAATGELLNRIGVLLCVIFTAYAAFASQKSSNQVRNSADCTQVFLSKTIAALNARTKYTLAQGDANTDLQKAQASFLKIYLTKPTPTAKQALQAFVRYFDALNHYIMVSGQSNTAIADNPYPSATDFKNCLNG